MLNTYTDSLDYIDALIDKGEDAWQVITSEGLEAQQNMDNGRWTIGDLAQRVDKAYGQDRISKFAKDINVDVGRVREYRTMCRFWEKSVRTEILEQYPTICYSHMKAAKRMGDMESALAFIEDCAANAWTVEQARMELNKRLGRPTPPLMLADVTAVIVGIEGAFVTFKLVGGELAGLPDAFGNGQLLNLKVYEKED